MPSRGKNHYYTNEYTHTINDELFATPMPFAMTTQVDRNEKYRPLQPASASFPLSIKSDSLQRTLA